MLHILYLAAAVSGCVLLAIACLWGYFRWKHRHLVRIASKIPSLLPTLPILGNLHYTFFGLESFTGWLKEGACELLNKGITTGTVWLGPYPYITVMGVEDIQKVLTSTKTAEKGDEMKAIQFFLKNGLLTAPGNIWKKSRRAIDPLFFHRNLVKLMPSFNKNCVELVDVLEGYEGQGIVDILPHVHNIMLKTTCHLIFGPELEFDIKSEEFRGLATAVEAFPEMAMIKILISDPIFNLFYSEKTDKLNKLWKTFSETPLKITKSNNVKMEIEENNYDQLKIEGPLNLLNVYSILQKDFPEFTDEDLKYEIITQYCVGSDSISALVSSCLTLIAQHQDVQKRLYSEISKEVHPNGDVTDDVLKRMTYLDQVYKETLRITTIVPVITRKASEEIQLSGCTIPAEGNVIVCLGGPLMNRKIYPEPLKFDPDRFSSESSEKRHKFAFVPFSGGTRQCIGKEYTHKLVKTMVVHVVRRFKLSTTMDITKIKRKLVIFILSTEGYKLSLEVRV